MCVLAKLPHLERCISLLFVLRSAKGVRASRAYIYIKEPMLAYDLRAKFDGHTFVNERGQQYQCSVEYAPYQKSPKVTTKKDPREGTLEKGTATKLMAKD